jgi:hypothetical protein
MSTPSRKAVEAAARSDAAIDGRGELSSLSRADRSRYLERAEAALTAALPHILAAKDREIAVLRTLLATVRPLLKRVGDELDQRIDTALSSSPAPTVFGTEDGSFDVRNFGPDPAEAMRAKSRKMDRLEHAAMGCGDDFCGVCDGGKGTEQARREYAAALKCNGDGK